MFCFACVKLISYQAHSAHFPVNRFWYNSRSTTNALRTRETYIIFFVCYMYTVMAYLNPALSFEREQKRACPR